MKAWSKAEVEGVTVKSSVEILARPKVVPQSFTQSVTKESGDCEGVILRSSQRAEFLRS